MSAPCVGGLTSSTYFFLCFPVLHRSGKCLADIFYVHYALRVGGFIPGNEKLTPYLKCVTSSPMQALVVH